MTDSETASSSRQIKADRFLRAVDLGTVAVVLFPLLYVAADAAFLSGQESEDIVFGLAVGLALIVYFIVETYAIFAAFRQRKADEFTQAMWSSGANFAFFAAVFWLFVVVWIEAILTGYFTSPAPPEACAAADDPASFVSDWASIVILGAFFAGVQLKRLRG